MANLRWHGDAFKAKLLRDVGRKLDAAAIVVENRAKVLISVDGTGVSKSKGVRDARGRFLKKGGRLVYGANPSKPPDPPHVQTGRLRASVAHEREGLVARVGTNVSYGRYLELGWSHSAARPWLRRALAEMTPAVNAILRTPII